MPELPEVETIARNLRQGHNSKPPLVGKRIVGVELLWPRTLVEPDVKALIARLQHQLVQDVGRRGKYLLINLPKDTLVVHLRMSGDLYLEAETAPIALHHRLVLTLEDPSCKARFRLVFNDPRKFGRIWLLADPSSLLGELGPEPLAEAFTSQWLYRELQKRQRQLKPLLLDQTFLAGLGNIYTDEALHRAHLHPLTISDRVSIQQAEQLWASIRAVLEEGIHRNGASIDWVYRGGDFQNHFRVYRRSGEPCYNCQTPIQRIIIGQRSTHFCPTCQPLQRGE